MPAIDWPFFAHMWCSICSAAAMHRRGWSQRLCTTFVEASWDDSMRSLDFLSWASGVEQSGPADHTTRKFEDLCVDLRTALSESCLKTTPVESPPTVRKSSPSSNSGSFHQPSGQSARSSSDTTEAQKQRMLLASARCSGRWNENPSPASGECGTFSQSPITGPWLERSLIISYALALSWLREWSTAASSSASFASGRFRTPRSHATSHEDATATPVSSAICPTDLSSTWPAETCSVDRWRDDASSCGAREARPPSGSSSPSRYSHSLTSRKSAAKRFPTAGAAAPPPPWTWTLSLSESPVPARFRLSPYAPNHLSSSYSTWPPDTRRFCGSIPCPERRRRAQTVGKSSASGTP
mmetsp:Transcript_27334/g.62297  ORF Transcript_27334/g.62297 Transcript_27334/m.62297 type:complete len:354 (+) Transcript_27334:1918-2979(+)